MNTELEGLRERFGRFLLVLLWTHVPVLGIIASLTGHSVVGAIAAGSVLAGAYHLTWWQNGAAPVTRYVSAVALVWEPALLLYLLSGHAWQMDMHMYFFAMLALTIAWFDKRAVLVAAVAIALHHLLLLYLLPYAVFPAGGNLPRVLLHAGIVAFQAAVLVWLSDMVMKSFARIGRMSAEIVAKNEALEQRTREAEDANRAKGLFLANISHEIRTPMNAILGFCHLANRTDLSPKQQDYVTKINSAGMALLRLINDILDFSKNEAGKLALEARPFDLRTSLENQIQLVAADAAAKGVAIECNVDDAIPKTLVGDELRFNQVVLNLLSNATKFSDRGSIIVSASMLDANETEATIQFSVRDSGIGMSPQQQAALFQSFNQADNSMTRRFGGTGLGLAICKQIVEQMGGQIGVSSAPGKGSTFTFSMVLKLASGIHLSVPLPASNFSRLRILVADDNPAARQIILEIFQAWDMTVDLVASGQEAMGALESASGADAPYDLILLDWKMPGMGGIETVRAMRENSALKKLPATLVITAYGNDEFMAQLGKEDVAAFIAKPVDPQILFETISNLFPETALPVPAPQSGAGLPMVAPDLRGLRVLLVEDNDINREIAVELLQDAGLLVDTAENGRIACEKVADGRGAAYAAVLMDVQMPEVDGIEATTIIRRQWAANLLPIVAMTAHAYEEERQRCFAAGMNDHIAKPVDPTVLVQTLNRWLKKENRGPLKEASPAPAAATAMESGLPDELPPFGIKAALVRMNGKSALLRKLIVNFGDRYAGIAQELRALVEAGDVAEARRAAHTLKGVAGSLELPDVQDMAARIERLIATGELDDIVQHMNRLEALVAPAIQAARRLAPLQAPPAALAGLVVDDEKLVLARTHLRDQIKRRSLQARHGFEALATAMGLTPQEAKIHPLRLALDCLDYDKALVLLDSADAQNINRDKR